MPDTDVIEIRPLDAGDVEIVQWVLYAAIAWNDPPGLPPLDKAIRHPELLRYHEDWGRRGDFGVKGLADGVMAGAAFARLFTDDDHGEGFVDAATPELGIAVAEDWRRLGLGRRLLDALADEARRLGMVSLSLSVNDPNPAKQLYESLGYRTIEDDGESSIMVLDL